MIFDTEETITMTNKQIEDAEAMGILVDYKDVKQLADVKPAVTKLLKLQGERKQLEADVDILKKKESGIKDEIEASMMAAEVDSFACGNRRVTRVEQVRWKLDKAKLLKNGVTAAQIKKSEVKSAEYSYLKISEIVKE